MFKSLQSKSLAIDLGSSEIRMWLLEDRQEVMIDDACLAVEKKEANQQTKVLAIGKDALETRGRLGDQLDLIWPIQAGRVVDYPRAKILLREFLKRVLKADSWLPLVGSPVVMLVVPASSSQFSRQTITKLFYELGASEVYLLVQPLAAAIGVGVPIADASGSFIFQMGASLAEAAVIALGSLVAFESSDYLSVGAGFNLDEKIRHHLKREQQFEISLESADSLKRVIGTIDDQVSNRVLLTGKSLKTQAPMELKLSSTMIQPVINELKHDYLALLKRLLKQIPPELMTDVIDKGLLLSGNLSKLNGWDQFLIDQLGIPVSVVDDPDLAAVKGALTVLQNLDLFKESIGYART